MVVTQVGPAVVSMHALFNDPAVRWEGRLSNQQSAGGHISSIVMRRRFPCLVKAALLALLCKEVLQNGKGSA